MPSSAGTTAPLTEPQSAWCQTGKACGGTCNRSK